MILAHVVDNLDTHYALTGLVFVSVSIGAAIVLVAIRKMLD